MEDKELKASHKQAVKKGVSEDKESSEYEEDLHFITFSEKDNFVLEFDGLKNDIINHGATTKESWVQDAMKVIDQFVQRDPDNVNFGIIALAPRPIE